jgi:hypothetical protein
VPGDQDEVPGLRHAADRLAKRADAVSHQGYHLSAQVDALSGGPDEVPAVPATDRLAHDPDEVPPVPAADRVSHDPHEMSTLLPRDRFSARVDQMPAGADEMPELWRGDSPHGFARGIDSMSHDSHEMPAVHHPAPGDRSATAKV